MKVIFMGQKKVIKLFMNSWMINKRSLGRSTESVLLLVSYGCGNDGRRLKCNVLLRLKISGQRYCPDTQRITVPE